jgi:hypothetical protein
MRTVHLGHFLVLARIQLAVSLSLPHFSSQMARGSQSTGWWDSREQRKQKRIPHEHAAVLTLVRATKALLHPAPGHQAMSLEMVTKCLSSKSAHLSATAAGAMARTVAIVTASPHPSDGHFLKMQLPPSSDTADSRKPLQHERQKMCLRGGGGGREGGREGGGEGGRLR